MAGGGVLALIGGMLLALDRRPVLDRMPDPEDRARCIGEANGIIVGYGAPSTFYVPPFLPGDAVVPLVNMRAAEPSAVWFALDGIETSLAQYPPGFVARLIKAVFICGEMTIDGERAGGTYGPAWLLLAAPSDIGSAGIARTARLGVHHELSSFVYFRNAQEWQKTVPSDWLFPSSVAGQLKGNRAPPPPPEMGFLNAYGATSPENDFNVYAEKMFTEMETVMQLARRIPIVARKAQLVRESYEAIDPRMHGVFSALGMTDVG
jgi:hypothetical protein